MFYYILKQLFTEVEVASGGGLPHRFTALVNTTTSYLHFGEVFIAV